MVVVGYGWFPGVFVVLCNESSEGRCSRHTFAIQVDGLALAVAHFDGAVVFSMASHVCTFVGFDLTGKADDSSAP